MIASKNYEESDKKKDYRALLKEQRLERTMYSYKSEQMDKVLEELEE